MIALDTNWGTSESSPFLPFTLAWLECQTILSYAVMKTVSVREFFHSAGLVDGLPEGQQLVVTANGKPKFVVSRSRRPKMTRKLAEARAVGSVGARKFDGSAFLASLKRDLLHTAKAISV
jgi:antitoxin (DNA-binding transcriptional repressor) of toxin-antitoxin stability system